ncbi:MAG: hypothetical protein ACTSWD_02475 [Candidatus Heimdallarchaeota archaeon]
MHEETANNLRAEHGYPISILDVIAKLIVGTFILSLLMCVVLLVINHLEFSLIMFGASLLLTVISWAFIRVSQL